MANPYAVIFKGCDDGHVGLRFSSKQEMYDYLKSLVVFEDVFKNQNDAKFMETLIRIKKENPEQSIRDLLKHDLQSQN